MVRAGRTIPLPASGRRRMPWAALLILAALLAILFWGAEAAGRRRPDPFPLTKAERDGLKLIDAPLSPRLQGAPAGGPMRFEQLPGAPGSSQPIR